MESSPVLVLRGGMTQVGSSLDCRTRAAASARAAAVGFRSTPTWRNRLRALRYRSEITWPRGMLAVRGPDPGSQHWSEGIRFCRGELGE